MIDFALRKQRTGQALGDSICLASLFAHFGKVRWHADPYSISPVWLEVNELFGHLYELEVVPTWNPKFASNAATHGWELIDNRVKLLEYKQDRKEDYVTLQTQGSIPWKKRPPHNSAPHDWNYSKYTENKEVVMLNNAKHLSVKELFETVSKGQKHVGVCSGITWVAAVCHVPIVMHEHNYGPCGFCKYLKENCNIEIVSS